MYYKAIQLMLAPAVMISACGLLLLGISNKYSSINNRIRLLTEERRRLHNRVKDGADLDYLETTRMQSIAKQLTDILYRARLVRNAVAFYVTGLFFFIVTSLVIGLDMILTTKVTDYVAVSVFIIGMISVGIGLIFSLKETLKGYTIIEVEVKAEE
ncbi:MAG: DUF2721 domain-containing protein [Bacteroidetes bacterium]|nr:DUF2721 domain-containing protein [Bacteroidota bacterium]